MLCWELAVTTMGSSSWYGRRRRRGMSNRLGSVLWLVGLALVGCDAAPAGTTCTRDVDCSAGTHCGTGQTCVSECSATQPCSGAAICDARGRCASDDASVHGDSGPHPDGSLSDGAVDAGPTRCATDTDCDDHTFCNGVEHCQPTMSGADARGCTVGAGNPCTAPATCNETTDHCDTPCDVNPDMDGDHVRAIACGGTDCDDTDATRFPGNTEVCTVASPTHDEDCNPETYGTLDADGDGVTSHVCCNVDSTGTSICGTDCDDSSALRSPTLIEVCDGIDNDCGATDTDASIDEGVLMTFYPDSDHDGYGDTDTNMNHIGDRSMIMLASACTAPAGFLADHTDCRDDLANVNPGAGETRCDGADDNCNGMIDEGLTGVSCSTGLPGACAAGTRMCTTGGGTTCHGTVAPMCTAGASMSCNTCPGYPLNGTRSCDGCTFPATCNFPATAVGNYDGNPAPVIHACGQNGGASGWFYSMFSDPMRCLFVSSLNVPVPPGTYAIDLYGLRDTGSRVYLGVGANATSVSATGNHASLGLGDWTSTVTWRQTACAPVAIQISADGLSATVETLNLRRTGP